MFILDGERAGRLRRELAVKLNRDVSQQEVADEVSKRLVARNGRAVSDQVIRRLERGRVQRLDLDVVNELAAFYAEHGLDASMLLRYVDENGERSTEDSPGNHKPARVAA